MCPTVSLCPSSLIQPCEIDCYHTWIEHINFNFMWESLTLQYKPVYVPSRYAGVQRRLWSPRPGLMPFLEGYSGTSWERSTGPTSSPKRSKWSSVRSGWVLALSYTTLPCHEHDQFERWFSFSVFFLGLQLPYVMNELTLTELDMGFSIPKILHASSPSVDHQGRCVLDGLLQ